MMTYLYVRVFDVQYVYRDLGMERLVVGLGRLYCINAPQIPKSILAHDKIPMFQTSLCDISFNEEGRFSH
jgi:hypothetical protein